MRYQPMLRAVVLAALLAAGSPASAQLSFTEDFSTTTYKDVFNTTADWNTAAGELRLFPFAIANLATYDTPGVAVGVAVSGDLLFVADDPNVVILDIANPAAPTLLGTFAAVDAQGVEPHGDLLYVAAGTAGLKIAGISNPAAPTQFGTVDTANLAWDVTVQGDVAYVANGTVGLLVFDVSDPLTPAQIGSYDTPGEALRVDVDGDYCYIADRSAGGLVILDVTDPTTPTLAGSILLPGDTWSVVVDGDLAYVGVASAGLTIVDVSDPTAPAQLGTVDPGTVRQFWVSGDILYAAGFSLVHEIDVSNPNSPVLIESWDNRGTCSDVVVAGEHAFVADGAAGLQILQVRRVIKSPPAPVGAVDFPGAAFALAIAGDHAFVASTTAGLQVIDISDPTLPLVAGSMTTPGFAYDVVVAGDHAFVACHSSLEVIDISDPALPVGVASLVTGGSAFDHLAVRGNNAFLSVAYSGLWVVDIEDPTAPVVVGTRPTSFLARGIAVAGDYAFWAEGGGLEVVDVSDPTTPTLVASLAVPGGPLDVAVDGDHVYLAGDALHVVDVSTPSSPSLVGELELPNTGFSVDLAGDYAFLAMDDIIYGGEVWVIDIRSPSFPNEVGSLILPDPVYGIAVAGQHAFLGNGGAGLASLRVFQDEFETGNNRGQSLVVDSATNPILRARITTSQAGNVTWEVGYGFLWHPIVPGAAWTKMAPSDDDLVWRSTHEWSAPGLNPAVDDLHLEWLVPSSVMGDIADVPDDQGGEVRVQFARSGYDFTDETSSPATGYQVYQRLDAAAAAMVMAMSEPGARMEALAALDGIDASRWRALGDRRFVVGPLAAAAGTFPPGVWEAVGWVAATQSDSYTVRVSTTADSTVSATNWSVYLITTHTTVPSSWYVSSVDSGYSIDNIAPGVPQSFAVTYNTGSGNALSWEAAPEPDFQFYRVYRSTDPDFVPTSGDLVHETSTPAWNDPEYDGWSVHYKVTTLDHAGNESDPASAVAVTGAGFPDVPARYALHANAPNPFNPTTQIRYDVPVEGEAVIIRVFDVAGRQVRTLVEGPQSAGAKSVTWNGRDDRGRAVASGIYFYRMRAGSFTQTRKMTLLK
jgi:hypothetical protein